MEKMSVIARASAEALFLELPESSLKAVRNQTPSMYGPIVLRARRAGKTRLDNGPDGFGYQLVETPTGGVVLQAIAEDGTSFVRRLPSGWTRDQFIKAMDTLYHKAFGHNREVFLANNPCAVVE